MFQGIYKIFDVDNYVNICGQVCGYTHRYMIHVYNSIFYKTLYKCINIYIQKIYRVNTHIINRVVHIHLTRPTSWT